ncbi:hypothetical protein OS493_000846 [Desmophyllum pertusum]|uniref:Hexosyltransferase n=1 Tax=Desmophyllum pertusum TaxID=174260 RepID=A0A9W9ZU42_9CNID|nr:hypothetical protein OS493_000846 [Desmophyllum pertusum]
MTRVRKILRYFIVAITTVACLQLGLFLYTHFVSWKCMSSASSTTNSSPFCKELGSKQETVPPHWKPLKQKSTLITNRTCIQYYSLLILVSSAPANLQRRNIIRKTWAFESAFKPRWTTVFLVAQSRIQAESNSLAKEDEVYGDLVRADYYDHYWNQTLKIQMGFEWATRHCKFSFLLKVDDDVFVNPERVLSFLNEPSTPKEKLYAGEHRINPRALRDGKWKVTIEEYSETHYPDFCPGLGFVLSHDVVVSFVKAFDFVPYFRLDDVYVGMLANKTGIKIMHNAGFESYPPIMLRCSPHEGTLVRHGTEGYCLIY